jgi:hypothetical protein
MKMAKFFQKVIFPWKMQGKSERRAAESSEWRMVENSERRAVESSEWRIANGEWWKTANGEWKEEGERRDFRRIDALSRSHGGAIRG